MYKLIKLLFIVVFSISLYGCGYTRMNMSVPIDSFETPKDDTKAIVYFMRPDAYGCLYHAAVYDDEKFIGIVPYEIKLPYVADPGEHTFMVVSEAADFMKAFLLPGKTYYVEVVPRMGKGRARFSLSPITKKELNSKKVRKWINNAKLIKNNELAYQWAENNHSSVLKKKEVYLREWYSKPETERPFLGPEDGE